MDTGQPGLNRYLTAEELGLGRCRSEPPGDVEIRGSKTGVVAQCLPVKGYLRLLGESGPVSSCRALLSEFCAVRHCSSPDRCGRTS